ncbi:conserved hypothetical protein [Trichinella spiralis]|uniref:hypothetical protein n=1 Tax=Trichinella spiralis TaxID=6334 RepID=UPI0001EFCFDA|nr:conserved hypothetical protein [Trichinella spiralis]
MSSHEARTDANQCSRGVSIPFSSRPSVPLLITNSKKEFDIMTAMKYHFVLDSNGLRHHQKIFVYSQPMALSSWVSYGSDCVTVKTPHLERSVSNDVVILLLFVFNYFLIMKFFTKSSRAVQVLVRSIKVSIKKNDIVE